MTMGEDAPGDRSKVDVPTCSSGPLARLRWTIGELAGLVGRRRRDRDAR